MIRRLALLRHAKSSWDDPAAADHDRPLSRRGVKACVRLRKYLRYSGLAPDFVLCSSAVRAVQTWDAIRAGLAAEPLVEVENGLYTADADGLLARLNAVPKPVRSLLLIGHNPTLAELALRLAGDGEADALQRMRAKYPTGGVAELAFSGDWQRLAWGAARLEAFVVPRQLA